MPEAMSVPLTLLQDSEETAAQEETAEQQAEEAAAPAQTAAQVEQAARAQMLTPAAWTDITPAP